MISRIREVATMKKIRHLFKADSRKFTTRSPCISSPVVTISMDYCSDHPNCFEHRPLTEISLLLLFVFIKIKSLLRLLFLYNCNMDSSITTKLVPALDLDKSYIEVKVSKQVVRIMIFRMRVLT